MENLTRPLIDESCRLAFPEGLKELMTDISREVLRHQPQNLLEFITNYLSALMVSREHLTIADHLCGQVDVNACYQELEEELIDIGFGEEEAAKAKEIIIEYFHSGGRSKTNLMKKLLNDDVNIDERQQSKVKQAVHNAFRRHMAYSTTIYQSSTESELDEVDMAAKHTLKMYRKTRLSSSEYHRTADKVQASYRAYGVKRHKEESPEEESESSPKSDKNIRFGGEEIAQSSGTFTRPNKLSTVSSSTLAGSYLNLPRYVPYSVHTKEPLEELEETKERENATFNYTQDDEETREILEEKKISFQEPDAIEDHAAFADDESEASIENLTSSHLEKIDEIETVMSEYENDEEIDEESLQD